MLTYRQRDTIREAMDSVLAQNCRFSWEILVGDDDSDDGTADIVQHYCVRQPERCFLFRRTSNVGPTRNAASLIQHARGRYVAFLEGDDCWTDPDKLQLQVSHLQQNPDCSLVYHACAMVDGQEKTLAILREKGPLRTLTDLFPRGNRDMATSSMVGVNLYKLHSDWLRYFTYSRYVGDIPLKAAYLKEGRIDYLDRCMSRYRKQTLGGASYSAMDLNIQRLDTVCAYRAVHDLYGGVGCEGADLMQMRVLRDILESFCRMQRPDLGRALWKKLTEQERLRYLEWRQSPEGQTAPLPPAVE